jgi:hypothetical protein
MFTKSDSKFAALAADPGKRHAMIANRQYTRTLLFWGAVLITICNLFIAWSTREVSGSFIFVVLAQWMIVLKFDSDVRMLCAIDAIDARHAHDDPA